MTKQTKLPRTLYGRMLFTILAATLCAALIFSIISGIGALAVGKIYMSPQSVAARKADIYSRFSSFVSSNHISGTDSAAVAKWMDENEYVTILVYSISTRSNVKNAPKTQLTAASDYSTQFGKLYPLEFADGRYQIAIGDSSQSREYTIYNLAAAAIAALFFFAILLMYISRLTRRIVLLSRNAAEVGAGDFNKSITATGDDELSMLAREMDNMRRSVIERMRNEQRAWEANSELITAVSHDIRTPMTTMIGYLGLMNEGRFDDAERLSQYTAAAYSKALELKDLTDELFKYFLVFGKAELEMEMESFDARLLLGQLLGEAEFALVEAGFDVQRKVLESDCSITTDPLYLKRVVDNLVSNVKKYSSMDKPVIIVAQLVNSNLSVCFSNNISRSMDRVESTKIGLRTCIKIMEHMGGTFVSKSDGDHFSSEFILPCN